MSFSFLFSLAVLAMFIFNLSYILSKHRANIILIFQSCVLLEIRSIFQINHVLIFKLQGFEQYGFEHDEMSRKSFDTFH